MLTEWNPQTAGTETPQRWILAGAAAQIKKVFSWKQDLSPLPFLTLGKYPKGFTKMLILMSGNPEYFTLGELVWLANLWILETNLFYSLQSSLVCNFFPTNKWKKNSFESFNNKQKITLWDLSSFTYGKLHKSSLIYYPIIFTGLWFWHRFVAFVTSILVNKNGRKAE